MGKFLEIESRFKVTKDWGEEGLGNIAYWLQSFCLQEKGWGREDEKVLEIDSDDSCPTS